MSDDLQTQIDAFMALPKEKRRAEYAALPHAVKVRVRKISESGRGIARREDGGVMVLTKEAYLDQLKKLQEKKADLPKRIKAIDVRMVDLKRQVKEHYGDEAIDEIENALEAHLDSINKVDEAEA